MLLGGGSRPDVNKSFDRAQAIVVLPINAVNISLGERKIVIGPMEMTIDRPGVIRWFRVVDAQDNALLDGDVGRNNGDLPLTRTDVLAGDVMQVGGLSVALKA